MYNNIVKRLAFAAMAATFSMAAFAQGTVTLTGKVTDQAGQPMPGVNISVPGTTNATITNFNGEYSLTVPVESQSIVASFVGYNNGNAILSLGQNKYDMVLVEKVLGNSEFEKQTMVIGRTNKSFSRAETTAAIGVVSNKHVDQRGAKNIAHSIIGEGQGLISLDGSGKYYENNPVWYVRGLQTLDDNSPLVLVDGIERDITTLNPMEVEEVYILKDAAALALYGDKAMNGAVYVKTKRGVHESMTISASYEHVFSFNVDKPEFLDAATYAEARNEALWNEGKSSKYSAQDIYDLETGAHPYQLPDVDWVKETFRNVAHSNRLGLEFTGGGKKFTYYTALSLTGDHGFINNDDVNDGYKTQDLYSRANLRSNIDVDMTEYTHLQINVGAVLSEIQKPGKSDANIWGLVYQTPSLAMPIRNDKGTWGGNSTWKGTINPVANATGSGYFKYQERQLFADIKLEQSLGLFVEGLSVFGQIGFDNCSRLYEDRSKDYVYGMYNFSRDEEGNLVLGDWYQDGLEGTMAGGNALDEMSRRATTNAGFTYDKEINDDNKLYAQLRWDYDFEDGFSASTTIYRHKFSWWSHYAYKQKYMLDLSLVGQGSSRLAPGHKWSFAPTVSAAWALSNEDFLVGNDVINFAKIRASFGKLQADWLPSGDWSYYMQLYSGSAMYPWDGTYQQTGADSKVLGRMASTDVTTEKAYKFNVGLDARLFNSIDLTFDYFSQQNKDAWVDGAGAYSSVIGLTAPWINQGQTKSHGIEFSLEWNKSFGDLNVNLGGNFLYSTSEIVDMAEEVRAFPNLVETGSSIAQLRGYVAEGLFKNQAEIDAAPKHTLDVVRPGDVRYKDVNGDGQIDANDKTAIGYSTSIPEIYYQFHLGADWKGLSFYAMFQGVGHYTAMCNVDNYYWGLHDNKNIAKHVYEGRWTPENVNAEYPRLMDANNANNLQNSTFWMRNRSFLKLRNVELAYDFSASLLKDTKVKGCKLFVRGINLFTADKMEHVDAASYGATDPQRRSVSAGLQLTF